MNAGLDWLVLFVYPADQAINVFLPGNSSEVV
jgi:hypothetical protein